MISTRSRNPASSSRSSRTRSVASGTVLFIFQLPAITGRRFSRNIDWLLTLEGCDSRQQPALEKLQRSPSSGGDVGNLVGKANPGIAAALSPPPTTVIALRLAAIARA